VEVMVVIRVPAFVAAGPAAAEAVVPAVLLLRCSLPAQRHRHLRPGGAAADPAGLPLLLRRRLRLRRRRPEAAAGLPVGMAAVAASVVAVAASGVCQARLLLRRRRQILSLCCVQLCWNAGA
jgi:hypothetical protein